EFEIRIKSGQIRIWDFSSGPLGQLRDERRLVISMATDITERKQAEEELEKHRRHLEELVRERTTNNEKLRTLGVQLARLEEEARRRFARELHDQVGQSLTALGMNLNFVRGQLTDDTHGDLAARIGDAAETVTEITVKIRDIMSDLRPAVLDDFGLPAALRWYCERIAGQTSVTVTLVENGTVGRLPLHAETAFFRIVQEALTNVVKHAGASSAEVLLEVTPEGTRMTISDDGAGMDSLLVSQLQGRSHWGLIGMEERARGIGGTVTVESELGVGTRIIVEVKGDLDGAQDNSG
ncbi:MAG: sensor histidine kinase, partial [Spirochaetia bacterium]